jgi:hypothetical protein
MKQGCSSSLKMTKNNNKVKNPCSLASVVVHEAGHAMTAMVVGAEITDVGFTHVNFKFHGNGSFAKLQAISLSGYLAQNIAAEIILQNKSWHDDSFALGMFSAAHYVNLSNAVRFLRKQGDADNDISTFSSFGGNGYVLAAGLYRLQCVSRGQGYGHGGLFQA